MLAKLAVMVPAWVATAVVEAALLSAMEIPAVAVQPLKRFPELGTATMLKDTIETSDWVPEGLVVPGPLAENVME